MNNYHITQKCKAPKRRIIPVFIPHLGCMYDCVFCDQNRISGQTAPADSDDVRRIFTKAMQEPQNNKDLSHPIEIAFYGGSFTALPVDQQDDLLATAHELLSEYPNGTIRLSTRPDCVDLPTILRLKRYGVKTIELGAQSMCDEVLIGANRGHTSSDVSNASKIIKSEGISLILQMMTGLPNDSTYRSIYTAEQIASLKPDGVRIYPTVVVRGTKLHERYQSGAYIEHTVEDAVNLCAELVPIFEDAQIPIIRMGLNPTDELSGGEVVAGAYHPSFGELVYSRIMYNIVTEQLEDISAECDIDILVPKGMTSKMIGQRRCNIDAIKEKYLVRSVRIIESDELDTLQEVSVKLT